MTVRELIEELLYAPMDAEIDLAVKKGEFGDVDSEEPLKAVRIELGTTRDTVYLCSRDRNTDYQSL